MPIAYCLLPLDFCLLPLALVVRYGADYLKAGYKVQDEGKSAPNAPYWTPDSRFPFNLIYNEQSTVFS
ncbi:MAG: hypothetical protein F6K26_36960 [Moorea sp. SIO2I5]|nr:hypothetical protein [Moorena sp. SIO2I5]